MAEAASQETYAKGKRPPGAPTADSSTLDAFRPQAPSREKWVTFPPPGSLAGKTVAVFGTGDQNMYPFNFCDAMDELARAFVDQASLMRVPLLLEPNHNVSSSPALL